VYVFSSFGFCALLVNVLFDLYARSTMSVSNHQCLFSPWLAIGVLNYFVVHPPDAHKTRHWPIKRTTPGKPAEKPLQIIQE